jgi:hypothetical protein
LHSAGQVPPPGSIMAPLYILITGLGSCVLGLVP